MVRSSVIWALYAHARSAQLTGIRALITRRAVADIHHIWIYHYGIVNLLVQDVRCYMRRIATRVESSSSFTILGGPSGPPFFVGYAPYSVEKPRAAI